MQIGVSNPNVPIFPPRVCTLVLFIYPVPPYIEVSSSGRLMATIYQLPKDLRKVRGIRDLHDDAIASVLYIYQRLWWIGG